MNEIIKNIELRADELVFFSQGDEDIFFEWIKKIKCIIRTHGKGRTIFMETSASLATEQDLREIIALFHRYGISMRQLEAFDGAKFAEWFRRPDAYWYSEVFKTLHEPE